MTSERWNNPMKNIICGRDPLGDFKAREQAVRCTIKPLAWSLWCPDGLSQALGRWSTRETDEATNSCVVFRETGHGTMIVLTLFREIQIAGETRVAGTSGGAPLRVSTSWLILV